jgi:signal transduction histidine kinase
MEEVVGHPPEVVLAGPVDQLRDPTVIDNLLPSLREALANAGKHAEASSVVVRVAVGETVRLEVVDDGVGLPDGVARSGLANLDARARALGGVFLADRAEPAGTRIVWEVPVVGASGSSGL